MELKSRLIEEDLDAPAMRVRGVEQSPLDVIDLEAFTEIASVIAAKIGVAAHQRKVTK